MYMSGTLTENFLATGGGCWSPKIYNIVGGGGGGYHFLEFMWGGSLNFVVMKGVGQDILFSY